VAFPCLGLVEAGEAQGLQLGARVRVWAMEFPRTTERTPLTKVTGRLVGIDDIALRVETSAEHPPVVVPRQDVSRIELSIRRGRRGKGALIGLAVGVVAGAVIVATDRPGSDSPNAQLAAIFELNLEGPEYDAGAIVLLGAIGAGLGALVAPGEKWETLTGERVRLVLGPAGGGGRGLRFGLSFAF